ncbi:EthD family reductase [Actinosynnema sp. NPDC050801]|uniref:EthD domain-containing protein n=1 Tax=unclassified Actinosynnema TaxID=2637065 RepID=UPI0033E8BA6C
MIHQLIFAYPRPGMDEQEFHRYWVEEHAVRYASRIPQIRQYAVDTRVELALDEPEPLWSGVAEIWLANEEEQLASLQTPEFLEGARLDEPRWAAFWRTLVLDTDAHVVVPGPPQRADAPGTKLFVLVKRREGMPLTEFRQYSRDAHAPLMAKVPGLRRYYQNHTRDGAYGIGEATLDCAYQLWFDDAPALRNALRTPEFQRAMADLATFTEPRYVHTLAVRENWILGPSENIT